MLRRVSHEDRLRIASEIRDEVKKALGEDLRAFVIFASTAKRQDGPYSDLELMVITTDDYEETACGFMRDGVYCEVYYVPYLVALKDAVKIDYEWPVSADQWHCMLPLYVKENDDCLDQIREAAKRAMADETKLKKETACRVMGVLEEIGSLINAWEAGVRSDVCTHFFSVSYSALILVAFINKHFYPSLRNAWEESKEFAKLPKGYVDLIATVHGETEVSLEDRYKAALKLWQNILDWMKELGINWTKEGKFELPKKVKK